MNTLMHHLVYIDLPQGIYTFSFFSKCHDNYSNVFRSLSRLFIYGDKVLSVLYLDTLIDIPSIEMSFIIQVDQRK